jgi:hypothetical protein
MRDYFQNALQTFNGGDWYGWKKYDDDGNKIPNSERMQYQHIKIIKDGATIPSESDVNAKIQEIKDEEQAIKDSKTSAINKISSTASLTSSEKKALFGV